MDPEFKQRGSYTGTGAVFRKHGIDFIIMAKDADILEAATMALGLTSASNPLDRKKCGSAKVVPNVETPN